jgi:hypothetical protein
MQKYAHTLRDNNENNVKIVRKLAKMYGYEYNNRRRKIIMQILIKYLSNKELDVGVAAEVFYFGPRMNYRVKSKRENKISRDELNLYNKNFKKWLCYLKANSSSRSIQRRLKKYFKTHNFICK